MNILILGGTRFFGVHLVHTLIKAGHQVTIATRGNQKDEFGDKVGRISVDRTDPAAMSNIFKGKYYDVICDNIAYCSNDVKCLLEVINCRKYILTSSCSVYKDLHIDTREVEYNPVSYPLQWCSRLDYPYDEVKRQAEAAVFQAYTKIPGIAVRFPYVIGEDDYTKRLYFYIEHILDQLPMQLDNQDAKISFIKSSEAGDFLAWLTGNNAAGTINAGSLGTITLQEVFDHVTEKTGLKPILSEEGEEGPYNGTPSFSMNTDKAFRNGYQFTELRSWIFDLVDAYIETASKK